MKRPLVATLIIGFVVAGIIGALHASGLLLRLELVAAELVPHHRTITRSVAGKWQYVFIVILSLGVAGLTLASSRRKQVGWLVLALLIELLGLCRISRWECRAWGQSGARHARFGSGLSRFAPAE